MLFSMKHFATVYFDRGLINTEFNQFACDLRPRRSGRPLPIDLVPWLFRCRYEQMKTDVCLPCIYDLLCHWSHTQINMSAWFSPTFLSPGRSPVIPHGLIIDYLSVFSSDCIAWDCGSTASSLCVWQGEKEINKFCWCTAFQASCLLWPKLMSALWHRREHPALSSRGALDPCSGIFHSRDCNSVSL